MALKYSIDGNQVCAVGIHFKSLATCHAGFGDSLKAAFLDYYQRSNEVPVLRDCKSWELPWADEIRPIPIPEETSLFELIDLLHKTSKENYARMIKKFIDRPRVND